MQADSGTETYTISDISFVSKTWTLVRVAETEDLTCSCCLFQRLGLLCRHILWLLRSKNAQAIPFNYIVHRWTKDAMKKHVVDKDGKTLDMYATLSDRKTLTTELWKEVYSCVSVVEDNEEDMKYLIEKLRDLQVEVKQKQCNIRTKKDKKKEM
jgi:hypothetical protein